MSALRAAAYAMPVVVMKADRQAAGSKAALPHSAAIVGADDDFDAALRRAGVVRMRVRVRQFTQLSAPRHAWLRAVGRWVKGWRSSPTAAARPCWPPTGPTRWA